MDHNNSKKISETLSYLMQICSKTEMCKSDIYFKLQKLNLNEEETDYIISNLENENFINEERYTGIFIRDKLKFNKWGKIKLRYYLKLKKIPENIINDALDNIDEKEYHDILMSELGKKSKSSSKTKEKDKLVRFAQSKGFELEMILSALKE
jgi:regulatory protein